LSKAALFRKGEKTPVYARFSTVAGGAGSVDTPRDVRGFAVKFYTSEGNWELVGNMQARSPASRQRSKRLAARR